MFSLVELQYRIRLTTRHAVQDVLVVTAPGSGAEIIPFLKTWVNLPAAIAFTVGYAQVRSLLVTSFTRLCLTLRCPQCHRNCLNMYPSPFAGMITWSLRVVIRW